VHEITSTTGLSYCSSSALHKQLHSSLCACLCAPASSTGQALNMNSRFEYICLRQLPKLSRAHSLGTYFKGSANLIVGYHQESSVSIPYNQVGRPLALEVDLYWLNPEISSVFRCFVKSVIRQLAYLGNKSTVIFTF
jgi:hypothetical protein